MASLVERLRHCSDNARDEYLHELTGRAADRITALEAMCETLAGYTRHDSDCVLGIPKAIRSRSSIQEECTCGLSEALTQYRAMKETNDG